MAIYVKEQVWASNNNLKKAKFSFKKDVLNIDLYSSISDRCENSRLGAPEAHLEISLMMADKSINKTVRYVAKQVIEHFGLSYAEWNKVAQNIRKMIREYG